MKIKSIYFLLTISMILLGTSCSKNNSFKAVNWLNELEYTKQDVYDISFSKNGIPQIPVKINNDEFDIQFDTGNSGDLLLTTSIEHKIKYNFIRNDQTYNGDGSYRGDIKVIQIDKLEVFKNIYSNISGVIGDWKLFSGNKFNGNIGLNYFTGKRVTLDYDSKKIAVSTSPLSSSDLLHKGYSSIPLLKPAEGFGELLFVQGNVNGKKTTIYLDTGIMPSHVEKSIAEGLEYCVDNNSKYGDFKKQYKKLKINIGELSFKTDKVYEHSIEMNTSFDEPVGIILGSDILKDFLITIDKIENRLIIKKNTY